LDLKLPIVICDELTESVIKSTGMLDLASGEIRNVQHEDYDKEALGLPAEDESYEFTSGLLSNGVKDVEFRVEVDVMAGTYSVTASELLELKGRAAKLFTAAPGAPAPTIERKTR
jgi:hypothetical protein